MTLRRVAAVAIIFVAGGMSAWAGGFADEHAESSDTIFFGTVQDSRGTALAGARVTLTFKKMSFIATTDAIGGYRIATPTDPEQSEISCHMSGYNQTGTTRRAPPDAAKGPVEIDCTMQKAP
jgi:hypothetical protein